MLSYHNDPALKALLVEEIEAHRAADQIVQGIYGLGSGKSWRGCAVGCAIHSLNRRLKKRLRTSDHKALAATAGWPEWLPYLADKIFEGLPSDEAKFWPGQLVSAIPVGMDLSEIRKRFFIFLLRENLERVRALEIAADLKNQVTAAIAGVLALYDQVIATGEWNESAASARSAAESAASARSAAESAASAAWSAAESAASAARSAASARSAAESAASAAWSAAESAESAARSAASARSAAESAESAAWSAAESADSARSAAESAASARSAAESAASAAESAAYRRYADELLRLLSEAGDDAA